MEPVCMIIQIKKKIWFIGYICKGSLFAFTDSIATVKNTHHGNCDVPPEARIDFYLPGAPGVSKTKIHSLNINSFSKDIQINSYSGKIIPRLNTVRLKMDGYTLSAFTKLLMHSGFYRDKFVTRCRQYLERKQKQTVSKKESCVIVKLTPAKREVLDYRWNERMITLAMERRELENAMYWLSTLGGAFSALGDEFQHCAVIAGRISLGQLWLALRLGDALTVARCKLFFALSLMQQGRLRVARHLVQQQYVIAKAAGEVDPRLGRMCKGVWAKLKYAYQIHYHRRKSKSRQA